MMVAEQFCHIMKHVHRFSLDQVTAATCCCSDCPLLFLLLACSCLLLHLQVLPRLSLLPLLLCCWPTSSRAPSESEAPPPHTPTHTTATTTRMPPPADSTPLPCPAEQEYAQEASEWQADLWKTTGVGAEELPFGFLGKVRAIGPAANSSRPCHADTTGAWGQFAGRDDDDPGTQGGGAGQGTGRGSEAGQEGWVDKEVAGELSYGAQTPGGPSMLLCCQAVRPIDAPCSSPLVDCARAGSDAAGAIVCVRAFVCVCCVFQ